MEAASFRTVLSESPSGLSCISAGSLVTKRTMAPDILTSIKLIIQAQIPVLAVMSPCHFLLVASPVTSFGAWNRHQTLPSLSDHRLYSSGRALDSSRSARRDPSSYRLMMPQKVEPGCQVGSSGAR